MPVLGAPRAQAHAEGGVIVFSLRFDKPDEAIQVLQSFFAVEHIAGAPAPIVPADGTQAVGFTAEFPTKETEGDEQ